MEPKLNCEGSVNFKRALLASIGAIEWWAIFSNWGGRFRTGLLLKLVAVPVQVGPIEWQHLRPD